MNNKKLETCPFCGGEMRIREHSAFHPENDCWLALAGEFASAFELDESDYDLWNYRSDAALAASRQECKRHPGKDEPMNCPQCVVEQRDALAQEEINRLTEAFTSEHRINQDLTAIVNDCIVLLMGNEYRNTHHFRQFQTTLSTSLFRDFGVNLLRTVADLRAQLTTALAERDKAREEVQSLETDIKKLIEDIDYLESAILASGNRGFENGRAEALEEAAKACESLAGRNQDGSLYGNEMMCAAAIRALMDETGEKAEK